MTTPTTFLSIGIIAYNEEASIGKMLASLFEQSVFDWLLNEGLTGEIICITNGCTDNTAQVADTSLREIANSKSYARILKVKTKDLETKGKTNALNVYYHEMSNSNTDFHVLADADIIFDHPDTILNLVRTLQKTPEASVSVDSPIKDISRKSRTTLIEKISLSTSKMTSAQSAQITGQLYCIRGSIARNIFFPKGLLTDDGYLKLMVCTDFMTAPLNPNRVARSENASHIFEAYTSLIDILNNQKRQIIGQTIIHVLCDKHLQSLDYSDKIQMANTLRTKELADPYWVHKLIKGHVLSVTNFSQLFPGLLTHRLNRLRSLVGARKFLYMPVALIGTFITIVAGMRAYNALKSGMTDYWPDTKNQRI